MKIRLLFWNVRKLDKPHKRSVVKNILRDLRVDVVFLQKTKLQCVDLGVIHSLWGNLYADWESLNAINTAGGVLMWDKRVLQKLAWAMDRFFVSYQWKDVEDGFIWSGTGVYGPTLDSDRLAFWTELAMIRNHWDSPWCVFGDFNAIKYPKECWGCSNFNQSMFDFSDFINGSNLINLPLEGGMFTWSNGGENPSMSRIDRLLVSPNWEEHFPNVRQ
jgi:exonuclease III